MKNQLQTYQTYHALCFALCSCGQNGVIGFSKTWHNIAQSVTGLVLCFEKLSTVEVLVYKHLCVWCAKCAKFAKNLAQHI